VNNKKHRGLHLALVSSLARPSPSSTLSSTRASTSSQTSQQKTTIYIRMRFSCDYADMYPEFLSPKTRKRGRDDEDDASLQGFSEHRRILKARVKDHNSAIAAHNISQNQVASSLALRSTNSPPRRRSNAVSTPRSDITPNGSDTEEYPKIRWTKPYSSSHPTRYSPDNNSSQSSLPDYPNSSQFSESQGQDSMDLDDEMDDADAPQLSQTSQSDSFTGRLPTPINCHFSSHIRPSRHSYGLGIEEATSRLKHDRRLPSPISEDEASPSIQLSGVGDLQMEMQDLSSPKEQNTSPRLKSGLRNWGHVSTGVGPSEGAAKRLSMGYRSDCEKCQLKVPGHYMHLLP